MDRVRILDVTDPASFGLVPPCADPGFDHRSCDYWEDADRGSKAARASWLEAPKPAPTARPQASNPFVAPGGPSFNPFASGGRSAAGANPFALDDADDALADNPFAARRAAPPRVVADAPRKLGLLGRGLAVFGSYAKVLLLDDEPVAYAQFGPLTAYPRASHLRELYPQLPQAPLPAVITCISTTANVRRQGHAIRLVESVCEDLAGRGFAAVEAYPESNARPDATSAATPAFWLRCGFALAVDDVRYPVVRRELT